MKKIFIVLALLLICIAGLVFDKKDSLKSTIVVYKDEEITQKEGRCPDVPKMINCNTDHTQSSQAIIGETCPAKNDKCYYVQKKTTGGTCPKLYGKKSCNDQSTGTNKTIFVTDCKLASTNKCYYTETKNTKTPESSTTPRNSKNTTPPTSPTANTPTVAAGNATANTPAVTTDNTSTHHTPSTSITTTDLIKILEREEEFIWDENNCLHNNTNIDGDICTFARSGVRWDEQACGNDGYDTYYFPCTFAS